SSSLGSSVIGGIAVRAHLAMGMGCNHSRARVIRSPCLRSADSRSAPARTDDRPTAVVGFRFLVASPPVRDLSFRAKDLFVAAKRGGRSFFMSGRGQGAAAPSNSRN